MPLQVRIAEASPVVHGKAPTGYLLLPGETQAAGSPPQLPCSSCSQLPALPKRAGGTGPLLSLSQSPLTSGRVFQSSGCKIKPHACKAPVSSHRSSVRPTSQPKGMCFILAECTGFSFSCLNSVLILLCPGPVLLKPSKSLGPFLYFCKT